MSTENPVVENAPIETPAQGEPQTPEINEHESLKKLNVDELVNIIAETRSEAKARRLKAKELEDKIKQIEDSKKLEEDALLEQNNEYKALYEKTKEQYKDYDELKSYKTSVLEKAKVEVENTVKHLTEAEKELYEYASGKMTYDEQLSYIKKLIGNRPTSSIIDTTQSVARTNKEKADPKSPLRGSASLDPILDGLRLGRETK